MRRFGGWLELRGPDTAPERRVAAAHRATAAFALRNGRARMSEGYVSRSFQLGRDNLRGLSIRHAECRDSAFEVLPLPQKWHGTGWRLVVCWRVAVPSSCQRDNCRRDHHHDQCNNQCCGNALHLNSVLFILRGSPRIVRPCGHHALPMRLFRSSGSNADSVSSLLPEEMSWLAKATVGLVLGPLEPGGAPVARLDRGRRIDAASSRSGSESRTPLGASPARVLALKHSENCRTARLPRHFPKSRPRINGWHRPGFDMPGAPALCTTRHAFCAKYPCHVGPFRAISVNIRRNCECPTHAPLQRTPRSKSRMP